MMIDQTFCGKIHIFHLSTFFINGRKKILKNNFLLIFFCQNPKFILSNFCRNLTEIVRNAFWGGILTNKRLPNCLNPSIKDLTFLSKIHSSLGWRKVAFSFEGLGKKVIQNFQIYSIFMILYLQKKGLFKFGENNSKLKFLFYFNFYCLNCEQLYNIALRRSVETWATRIRI